jgi:hypothetical protein
MKLPQTGGCQCGAIRYEITQTPQMVYTCHCTDCQRMTSSAFSMGCVLPEGVFRFVRGEPKAVQRLADSGRETIWWICPECGSWVCAARPGATVRNVRGGTLDDTSWLRPTVHFWTRSKQPWIALPDGGRNFETQPEDLIGFLLSTG